MDGRLLNQGVFETVSVWAADGWTLQVKREGAR